MCFRANQGVEDGQEFPHACGEDDFEGFACVMKPVGESADCGVASLSDEGGHVERFAHGGSSAANASLTAELPAVVVEGRHAGQGGDFLPIELTEFRQLSHECGTGYWSYAGHALDDVTFGAPLVIGVDQLGDRLVDLIDLPIEEADRHVDASLGEAVGGLVFPRLLHASQADELPPASRAHRAVAGFPGFFASAWAERGKRTRRSLASMRSVFANRLRALAKSRMHRGLTTATVQAASSNAADHRALHAASRLDDDQCPGGITKFFEESFGSAVIDSNRKRASLRKDVDIPGGLGDVNADKGLRRGNHRIIHGRGPVLWIRAGRPRRTTALASVRANSIRPTTIPVAERRPKGAQTSTICRRSRPRPLRASRRLGH